LGLHLNIQRTQQRKAFPVMVAIGSALGSEYSDQWVESMTETPNQRDFLKAAAERAREERSKLERSHHHE
jgi:hypothetical protein